MSLTKTIGACVRHYRQIRGLNQRQCADAAGLSPGMMGKVERGETAPSPHSVEKIAAALDVPAAVLFGADITTVPTGERGQLL